MATTRFRKCARRQDQHRATHTALFGSGSPQGLCMLLQVSEHALALADGDGLHQVFKQPEHQTCSAGAGTAAAHEVCPAESGAAGLLHVTPCCYCHPARCCSCQLTVWRLQLGAGCSRCIDKRHADKLSLIACVTHSIPTIDTAAQNLGQRATSQEQQQQRQQSSAVAEATFALPPAGSCCGWQSAACFRGPARPAATSRSGARSQVERAQEQWSTWVHPLLLRSQQHHVEQPRHRWKRIRLQPPCHCLCLGRNGACHHLSQH